MNTNNSTYTTVVERTCEIVIPKSLGYQDPLNALIYD
jgi:hypothetical protein